MARLHGAALRKRVEKQLRETLAADYGLPMQEYDCTVSNMKGEPGYDSDPDTLLFARFTRKETGAVIQVDSISADDAGNVIQHFAAELR